MTILVHFWALTLFVFSFSASAQPVPSGNVIAVEYSVPFGTVAGKLLLLGNYLVFADEQQLGVRSEQVGDSEVARRLELCPREPHGRRIDAACRRWSRQPWAAASRMTWATSPGRVNCGQWPEPRST